MKYEGFTFEQHENIGARLGFLHDELVHLHVLIGNAYGKNDFEGFTIAIKNIDQIRSDLDDILAKEHPEITDGEFTKIYYGNRPDDLKR